MIATDILPMSIDRENHKNKSSSYNNRHTRSNHIKPIDNTYNGNIVQKQMQYYIIWSIERLRLIYLQHASLTNKAKQISFYLNHIMPHPQNSLNSPSLERLHLAQTPRILAARRHSVDGWREARVGNIQTNFDSDNGRGIAHKNLKNKNIDFK